MPKAKANNIEIDRAHEALSDVRATIALAQLVFTKQRNRFINCDCFTVVSIFNNYYPIFFFPKVNIYLYCLSFSYQLCSSFNKVIHTINFKVVYDSDLLENLDEKQKKAPRNNEEMEKLIEKSFLTDSGRETAREVLLGG